MPSPLPMSPPPPMSHLERLPDRAANADVAVADVAAAVVADIPHMPAAARAASQGRPTPKQVRRRRKDDD